MRLGKEVRKKARPTPSLLGAGRAWWTCYIWTSAASGVSMKPAAGVSMKPAPGVLMKPAPGVSMKPAPGAHGRPPGRSFRHEAIEVAIGDIVLGELLLSLLVWRRGLYRVAPFLRSWPNVS